MLDMYDEPRFEPLEASTFFDDGTSARPLVAGTVARGDLRDDEALYTGKVDGKYVTELPVELDRALLVRGQQRFNIYCSPCHGRVGDGNGMIVQRGFRRPPSFVSTDRLLRSPVGHFYDVISNGFGAMPSYASRVEPRDRWAIVAYIRALQRSQNGMLDDVPTDQRDNILEREGVQEAEQRKREAAQELDVERQRRLQRDIREHRRSPEEGREKKRELERQNGSQEPDLKQDDKETRGQGVKGKATARRHIRLGVLIPNAQPHPACLDGEEDGGLPENTQQTDDPIRLVRMVKEMECFPIAGESYSPSRQAGWALCARLDEEVLAHHLVHHPHKADGVRCAKRLDCSCPLVSLSPCLFVLSIPNGPGGSV